MPKYPRTKVSEERTPHGHTMRTFDGPFFRAVMYCCTEKIIVQHEDKQKHGGRCRSPNFYRSDQEFEADNHCRRFARRKV